MRSSIRRTWRSVTFRRSAAATCERCFCLTSCNTFNRSRSRWLNAIRSVSIGPSATHGSGHFYFAQTGHSHFAATSCQRSLTLPPVPTSLFRSTRCAVDRVLPRHPSKESGMHFHCDRRLSFALTTVLMVLAGAPRLAAQGGEPRSFVIRGATVVPVSGPRIENATVVISRGVITAVGRDASFPQEAWLIDGKGLTVYPGLFDSFTDIGLAPASPPP